MKQFNKKSLPLEINFKYKKYFRDLEKTNLLRKGLPFQERNCIKVSVLARKLRGKNDLHGNPYQATDWIFSTQTLIQKTNEYLLISVDKLKAINDFINRGIGLEINKLSLFEDAVKVKMTDEVIQSLRKIKTTNGTI